MNIKYPNSLQALDADLLKAPDSEITTLAIELIEQAKIFDITYAQSLVTYPSYKINDKLIVRNKTNPVEFTHPSVLGAPGSDSIEKPICDGEIWNEGRRKTYTGAIYIIGKDGRAINPYIKTGLTGQGVLWQYGPDLAVDNGFIKEEEDKYGIPSLYTVGINRKDSSPDKAYFSGGFLKYEINDAGIYVLNKEAIINSKAEEFFEEMLSGSMELNSEYEAKFPSQFGKAVVERMRVRTEKLDNEKLRTIEEQVKVELKMEQVKEEFPDFFPRLRDEFRNAKECFAGPILNSARNSDNAWIESSLSWIDLSEEKLKHLLGNTGLKLAAGDDAANVKSFKMDETIIQNSGKAHTAMFAFMAASYILNKQDNGELIHPNIKKQVTNISNQLKVENSKLAVIPKLL